MTESEAIYLFTVWFSFFAIGFAMGFKSQMLIRFLHAAT